MPLEALGGFGAQSYWEVLEAFVIDRLAKFFWGGFRKWFCFITLICVITPRIYKSIGGIFCPDGVLFYIWEVY